MDEDFVKKRLEKDLSELKRIIEAHFVQRQKDEVELEELKQRIEKRKEYREQQLKQRAERERLRQEAEQLEKDRRAAEEGFQKLEDFCIILKLSRPKRRGRAKEERSNAGSFAIIWRLQSTSQTGKSMLNPYGSNYQEDVPVDLAKNG